MRLRISPDERRKDMRELSDKQLEHYLQSVLSNSEGEKLAIQERDRRCSKLVLRGRFWIAALALGLIALAIRLLL